METGLTDHVWEIEELVARIGWGRYHSSMPKHVTLYLCSIVGAWCLGFVTGYLQYQLIAAFHRRQGRELRMPFPIATGVQWGVMLGTVSAVCALLIPLLLDRAD
jgi:hypothetical protein